VASAGKRGKGGAVGKGGETTQTMYAHMNKIKIFKNIVKETRHS
jgi:hypothetical protein